MNNSGYWPVMKRFVGRKGILFAADLERRPGDGLSSNMNRRQEFVATFADESLGNAARCAFDRVFPPHPDPLPQGEGTAGV